MSKCNKMGFDSLKNANNYIKAGLCSNRKKRSWRKGQKMRVYKCALCNDYHMTSQTKKQSKVFK